MGSVHSNQIAIKLIEPQGEAPSLDEERRGFTGMRVSDERDPLQEHLEDIPKWDSILRMPIPNLQINGVFIRTLIMRLRGEIQEILGRPLLTQSVHNYLALNAYIRNVFNLKKGLMTLLCYKEDPVEKLRIYFFKLEDPAPQLRLILEALPSHRLYHFNVEWGP